MDRRVGAPNTFGALSRRVAIILAAASMSAMTFVSTAKAEELIIGGTGSALGTMRALGRAFEAVNPEVSVKVLPSLGSGGGIKALAAGKIDLSVSARPLKKKEKSILPGARSMLYGTTPLGLVTPRRDITALTSQKLAAIIDGTITSGPDGTPYHFILRPKQETDFQLLAAHSPILASALEKARGKSNLLMAFTDQQNLDLASKVEGALAMSTMSTVISESRELNPISLDGVAPTVENLAKGAYRLSRAGYIIVKAGARQRAQEFAAFALSDKGKEILKANGYLPARKN